MAAEALAVRVLVLRDVGDLHAVSDSRCEALYHFLAGSQIQADLVVALGSLGHRGDERLTRAGYERVSEISSIVSARIISATGGPHDVDQKGRDLLFLAGCAQQDIPSDLALGFSVSESNLVRVVTLSGRARSERTESGARWPDEQYVQAVSTELSRLSHSRINFLICPEDILPDSVNGEKISSHFMNMLEKSVNDWFVIGASQISPRLFYAPCGTSSASCFIPGTLADTYPGINRPVFHWILINGSGDDRGLVGHVKTWEWSRAWGWHPAQNAGAFQDYSGFGFRATLGWLAAEITKEITEGSGICELFQFMPEAINLLPQDIGNLVLRLKSDGAMVVSDAKGHLTFLRGLGEFPANPNAKPNVKIQGGPAVSDTEGEIERAYRMALADKLRDLVPGPRDAHRYVEVVGQVLSHLFDGLIPMSKEKGLDEGRKRADLLFLNLATEGFFNVLCEKFGVRAAVIPVECKNSSTDPEGRWIDQICGYMSHRRGQFGIVCCRKIVNEKALLKRCQEALDRSSHVIFLSDEDLLSLLEAHATGPQLVNEILYEKLVSLLNVTG